MAWAVYMNDDMVNTFNGVTYALHRIAGFEIGDALHMMIFVHEHGRLEVGRFEELADAELLAARLQVFGLLADLGSV